MGDQIFKSSEIEYSFINEKGYLLDVEGSFNTRTLIDDLSSNFSLADLNTIKSLIEFKKKKVLNTPGKIENWLFYSDKINIDGETWKSKRALFSNDLLESKQLKIVINSLQVTLR